MTIYCLWASRYYCFCFAGWIFDSWRRLAVSKRVFGAAKRSLVQGPAHFTAQQVAKFNLFQFLFQTVFRSVTYHCISVLSIKEGNLSVKHFGPFALFFRSRYWLKTWMTWRRFSWTMASSASPKIPTKESWSAESKSLTLMGEYSIHS